MMTVQQMVRSVREQIMAWYDQITGKSDARRTRLIQYVTVGLLGCMIVGLLFGGYRWYAYRREQAAQKSLSFCLDEYFKAQRGQNASWQELADRFGRAADSNASSYLYPHFKILQADALVHVGDLGTALKVMELACARMRSSDPLYTLSLLKYRLMQLDSADEATKMQGLAQLEMLAHDQKNMCADAAQFYLGQYYMAQNEPEKAQEEWKALMAQRHEQPGMSSPWAELAASKVTQ